jgi:hypothetical protein
MVVSVHYSLHYTRGVSEKTRTQCTPYGKKFYPQNTEEPEINKDT